MNEHNSMKLLDKKNIFFFSLLEWDFRGGGGYYVTCDCSETALRLGCDLGYIWVKKNSFNTNDRQCLRQ